MGWMDRLRTMFGGSGQEGPTEDATEEELEIERVQADIERDRDEARERRIETPTSLDD